MPALSYIDPITGVKKTIGGYKSGGSNVDIVQELGDSESKVISQKKVTEEISRLDNRFDSLNTAEMQPLSNDEIQSACND